MMELLNLVPFFSSGKHLDSGSSCLPVVIALATWAFQITGSYFLSSPPQQIAVRPSLTLTPITRTTSLPPTSTLFDEYASLNSGMNTLVCFVLVLVGILVGSGCMYIRCKTGYIFTPRSPNRKQEPDPPRQPPPNQPLKDESEYSGGDEGDEGGEDSEGEDDSDDDYIPDEDEREDEDEQDLEYTDDNDSDYTPDSDSDELEDSNDGNDGGDDDPDDPSANTNADLPVPPPRIEPSAWHIVAILIIYATGFTSFWRGPLGKRIRRLWRALTNGADCLRGPSYFVEQALERADKFVLWATDGLLGIGQFGLSASTRGMGFRHAVAEVNMASIPAYGLDDLPEFKFKPVLVLPTHSAPVAAAAISPPESMVDDLIQFGFKPAVLMTLAAYLSRYFAALVKLFNYDVWCAITGYGILTLIICRVLAARPETQHKDTPATISLINNTEEQFESVTMSVLEEMGEEEEAAAEETSKYADAHTRPSTAEINKEMEEQQQDKDADNEEEEEDSVYVDASSYRSAEVHTTATTLGPAPVIDYTDAAAPSFSDIVCSSPAVRRAARTPAPGTTATGSLLSPVPRMNRIAPVFTVVEPEEVEEEVEDEGYFINQNPWHEERVGGEEYEDEQAWLSEDKKEEDGEDGEVEEVNENSWCEEEVLEVAEIEEHEEPVQEAAEDKPVVETASNESTIKYTPETSEPDPILADNSFQFEEGDTTIPDWATIKLACQVMCRKLEEEIAAEAAAKQASKHRVEAAI